MDKIYWDYKVWNHWRASILDGAITIKDLSGTYPEFYENVFKITDESVVSWDIQPPELKKILRLEKDGKKYLFPLVYEDKLPVVVKDYVECQLKISDKTIHRYVTQVISKSIPQDSSGLSFKEFIDSFNQIDVSKHKDWTFLKILSVAVRTGSCFIAICGAPSIGKNANFTLLGLILPGIHRVGTPSAAMLYDELCKNDVLVVDEITNSDTEDLRGIEKYILPMTDGDPNFTKPKMPKGKQPRELDMTKKSLIFTYNRFQDINERRQWIDQRWGTPGAMSSRFPQLLVDNQILSKRPVFTKGTLNKVLEDNRQEMNNIAKQASYWVHNIHNHLHRYNRDKLKILSTRHYSAMSPLIDALDCYSQTQQEFDDWCDWLKQSIEDYKTMARGIEPNVVVSVENKEEKVYTLDDVDGEML